MQEMKAKDVRRKTTVLSHGILARFNPDAQPKKQSPGKGEENKIIVSKLEDVITKRDVIDELL